MRTYMSTLLAAVAVGFVSSPVAAMPINLIVNGDFEAGNVGFTTDLSLSQTNIVPANTYAIVADPSTVHGAATSYGDNTPGLGNVLMMAINGSTTSGGIVWSQDIVVLPMSTYDFAAAISSWVSTSPAQLSFDVNSQSIGMLTAPSTTGMWTPLFATWSSGTATLATISISNANTASTGNDFALDDLYFGDPQFSDPNCCNGGGGTVPEPGTLALLGFGVLMLRRRASRT